MGKEEEGKVPSDEMESFPQHIKLLTRRRAAIKEPGSVKTGESKNYGENFFSFYFPLLTVQCLNDASLYLRIYTIPGRRREEDGLRCIVVVLRFIDFISLFDLLSHFCKRMS